MLSDRLALAFPVFAVALLPALSVWLDAVRSEPSLSKVSSLSPTMRESWSLSSDSAIICQVVPPEAVVACRTSVMSTVRGVPSES